MRKIKNNILLPCSYPTKENIKDGMMSRINAIDLLVEDVQRVYLDISLTRFFLRRTYKKEQVTVCFVNLIAHLFFIVSAVKSASLIYLQSIYSARFIWPLLLVSKKKIILDAHGIVPEEERDFLHHRIKSLYYAFVERIVFKKASVVVCVTNAMKQYFEQKYPSFRGEYVVYNNLPANTLTSESENMLHPRGEKVEVLYSGGVNPWQNIELMMQTIARNQFPNVHYTILTNNIEQIYAYIERLGIDHSLIEVSSVAPEELKHYYQKADYAFILRDNHPVNRVANPTKMIEYLFYGIVPIVLSPRIGDYLDLGYEYITVEQFDKALRKPAEKSASNRDIALSIIENNKTTNIRSLIVAMLNR